LDQIIIDNIVITLERKRIRNLHLYVYPSDGRVKITAPCRISDAKIREFAVSKLSWIKKHQQKYLNLGSRPLLEYKSGETHYLWGEPYLLNLIHHNGQSKVVMRDGEYVDLYAAENFTIEQREKIIDRWYREKLLAELPALTEKWEKITGVKADHWRVKKMKTRWGTCNREAKRIWVSLELARKPKRCLEYIIVHELVHFYERNHTARFVYRMDKYMPFWREIKDEMNYPWKKQKE
jgi:predicted metal-dependent hydrolase